jgi:hypothetical protein
VAAIRRKRFSKEVDGGVYATDGIAMIVRPKPSGRDPQSGVPVSPVPVIQE